jgi:chemotaxis protein methyltransferase CheR
MTSHEVLHELARLIEVTSGNVVPPGHVPFLRDVVARRARALGLTDAAAYVSALARGTLAEEWRSLLPLITVKESFLFRTPQHFAALTTLCLPELLRARTATRRLRIWSAGCARGEEPATLAVALSEAGALAGWDWRIEATDVDEEALAVARSGEFSSRAVAQVPAHLLQRYFERRGDAYLFSPRVAARISFRALNLVHEPLPLPDEPFDVIFLRNVLIYFRPDSQRRVVAGIARALAPDGLLFLGPSETLWQISELFDAVDLGDCFCYRARRPVLAAEPEARATSRRGRSESGGDAARRSSSTPDLAGSGSFGPNGRPRVKRRAEAVDAPVKPAPESWGTREHLARASEHLRDNRLDDAAILIEEALRRDPADPEVHAVEGFIHDLSGRSQLAVASYRAALFLEPGLFQVRMLLADCLRRLGWPARAHQEYREVLAAVTAAHGRELQVTATLPLPTREQAARLARQALRAGGAISASPTDRG